MKWNSKQSESRFHIWWQLCRFKPQTEHWIKMPSVMDDACMSQMGYSGWWHRACFLHYVFWVKKKIKLNVWQSLVSSHGNLRALGSPCKMSMSGLAIPQFAPHWERAAMKKEEGNSSTRAPGAGPLQNPHVPTPAPRDRFYPSLLFHNSFVHQQFTQAQGPFLPGLAFMFPKAPCVGFPFSTAVSPSSVSGSGFYPDSSESYFTRLCKSFIVEVQVSHGLLWSQDSSWDSLAPFMGRGYGAICPRVLQVWNAVLAFLVKWFEGLVSLASYPFIVPLISRVMR